MSENIAITAGEETTKKKNKRAAIGIAALIIVVVVAVFAYRFLNTPNRSAANAAKATFRALYLTYDYDDFVEATIYNEVCQGALKMELTTELSGLRNEFDGLEEWMKEAGEAFSVKKVKAEEFDAETEEYKAGIKLFTDSYDGVEVKAIEKVGRATIEYSETYREESGKVVTKSGSDLYWCYYVSGKWYCHPALIQE